MKVAGAPITWGVSEVPGWGHQMAPERVLAEMRDVGLEATELGPDGFLPSDPAALKDLLGRYGLTLVAGFVPVVLHRPDRWEHERDELVRQVDLLAAGGAEVLVLAAATGEQGYESDARLGDEEWTRLSSALDEVMSIVDDRGLRTALHPHYGTVIETPEDVDRLLDVSGVPLCLDTGHSMVGGGDPVALARKVPGRITHVHLKDVRAELAERVRGGEVSYHWAVAEGMYQPLGAGDVDVAAIVSSLEDSAYRGWYVLEQDAVLSEEPPADAGPVRRAAQSRDFLNHARRDGTAFKGNSPLTGR